MAESCRTFKLRLAVGAGVMTLAGASMLATAFSKPQPQRTGKAYLGFDLNTFPGEQAMGILRKTFSFSGYWLNSPPGAKDNNWLGQRETLRAKGFGFLVLYNGRDSHQLKSVLDAKQKGEQDAADASRVARAEGFAKSTVIFVDIEEGGRLGSAYHAYIQAWREELQKTGFRLGVYCSGIPVKEGRAATITTAQDIRDHDSSHSTIYFIYNDACPPSPGCVFPANPPEPSAGGSAYAAVWQFAQSPRRKEFAARCPPGYNPDGNCYAPGDSAHAWFLDVESATSADPSGAGQ